jgi:hypothetical protein
MWTDQPDERLHADHTCSKGRARRTLADSPDSVLHPNWPMTRKFVYDPRTARVRMLNEGTGASAARWSSGSRPLRWLLVALVLTASVLAFDAAHAVARARDHVISAR